MVSHVDEKYVACEANNYILKHSERDTIDYFFLDDNNTINCLSRMYIPVSISILTFPVANFIYDRLAHILWWGPVLPFANDTVSKIAYNGLAVWRVKY